MVASCESRGIQPGSRRSLVLALPTLIPLMSLMLPTVSRVTVPCGTSTRALDRREGTS